MANLYEEFPIKWLKINQNCQSGDIITFLDKGEIIRKGKNPDGTDQVRFDINIRVERTREELGLTMNSTNRKATIAEYGPYTEEWIDKTMQVKEVLVNNPRTGERVESIALVAPK